MGLSPDRIASLLDPYLSQAAVVETTYTIPQLCERVSVYLDLLLRWNARTNLTSIRSPEEIVTRHFGESFFAAVQLPFTTKSVLDLGSGAGFPGLPIQLIRPEARVTLAESQHKKVAFLREAVRILGLKTEVWPRRAKDLPTGNRFDVVVLRAVDKMHEAIVEAGTLAETHLLIFGTKEVEERFQIAPPGFPEIKLIAIPNTEKRVVRIFQRS